MRRVQTDPELRQIKIKHKTRITSKVINNPMNDIVDGRGGREGWVGGEGGGVDGYRQNIWRTGIMKTEA